MWCVVCSCCSRPGRLNRQYKSDKFWERTRTKTKTPFSLRSPLVYTSGEEYPCLPLLALLAESLLQCSGLSLWASKKLHTACRACWTFREHFLLSNIHVLQRAAVSHNKVLLILSAYATCFDLADHPQAFKRHDLKTPPPHQKKIMCGCVCVCVCMYIYIYVCVCVCIYIYMGRAVA